MLSRVDFMRLAALKQRHRALPARLSRTRIVALLATGSMLLVVSPAEARPTPEQKCQAGKNIAAGKLAACLQNAEAKLTTTGDAAKYAKAKLDCSYKFAKSWLKLEATAARVGSTCPDAPLDQDALERAIRDCSASVSSALAGAGMVTSTPTPTPTPTPTRTLTPTPSPTSTITISYLVMGTPEVNTAACDFGTPGTAFPMTMNYSDPTGNVNNSTVPLVALHFEPSQREEDAIVPAAPVITGDGFNGTISFSPCVLFETDTVVSFKPQIVTDGGNLSNQLSAALPKPPGAN